jgi:pyrroloquinoline quinone biosynthesis protein B
MPVDTGLGITVTPFAVPGKVALYLENDNVAGGAETETTVGLEIGDGAKSFFYVSGCAGINEGVIKRLSGAALLFFDGTTFTDDEMVQLGLSKKTAWRMGHVAMWRPKARSSCSPCGIGRRFMFIST